MSWIKHCLATCVSTSLYSCSLDVDNNVLRHTHSNVIALVSRSRFVWYRKQSLNMRSSTTMVAERGSTFVIFKSRLIGKTTTHPSEPAALDFLWQAALVESCSVVKSLISDYNITHGSTLYASGGLNGGSRGDHERFQHDYHFWHDRSIKEFIEYFESIWTMDQKLSYEEVAT